MSAQIFQPFTLIPFELRIQVWNHALDANHASKFFKAGYIEHWDTQLWPSTLVFRRPNWARLGLKFVVLHGALAGESIPGTCREARLVALEWWYRQIEKRPASSQERIAWLKRSVLCALEELVVYTKAQPEK